MHEHATQGYLQVVNGELGKSGRHGTIVLFFS